MNMRVKHSMCLTALLYVATTTAAASYLSHQDKPHSLVYPDLAAPPPAPISKLIDRDRAFVGYHTEEEHWKVGLEYADSMSSGLRFDYALNLTKDIALGTNVTMGQHRQDVVLNGFFVPVSDLRFRVAGGQLHQTNDFAFLSGSQSGSIRQDNYLLDARKYWRHSLISDVGLVAYGARAEDQRLDPKIIAFDDSTLIDPRELAAGRLKGYQLNFALTPLPRTRLEFGRSVSQISYHYADGTNVNEEQVTNRARYTHYLDQCMQVQGGYDNAPYGDRVDIGVRKNAWQLGMSRSLGRDGNASDYAIRVNYAIPLGEAAERPAPCQPALQMMPAPKASAMELANRPSSLPADAMVRVDPTATLTHAPESGH